MGTDFLQKIFYCITRQDPTSDEMTHNTASPSKQPSTVKVLQNFVGVLATHW